MTTGGGWNGLGARARAVATAIALGRNRADVAAELGIDVKTFDSHRLKALDALGLDNSVQLARYAIACGAVPIDGDVRRHNALLDRVYAAIVHGDADHQQWLRDRLAEFKIDEPKE